MISKQEINLVVVDDHVMFLTGLKAIFQDEDNIHLVAALSNSELVMEVLEKEPVDIVVIDLSMPGINGTALNTLIKKKYPNIKTLVLSTYNDPGKIDQLMKNNVDGYLLKNAEPAALIEAIHSIFSNEKYFSDEVQQKYMKSLFSNKDHKILTNREIEILKLITAEYTTAQIAYELSISEHTVNTHRKNLLFKLDVKNTAGLVKYALQNI